MVQAMIVDNKTWQRGPSQLQCQLVQEAVCNAVLQALRMHKQQV
jgi:hypothetical protein